MFERYTEKARRAIFFARYEAAQYGSPYIESEHLLLGLLREDASCGRKLLGSRTTQDAVRRAIESRMEIKRRIASSVDVPLTQECHRILRNSAVVADRLKSRFIGTEHLFAALFSEKNSRAVQVLGELGVAEPVLDSALVENYEPPSASLRKMLEDAVTAWIQRDLNAVLEFVAGDALLVDRAGFLHRGREAIWEVAARARIAESSYDTRRLSIEELRMIRPEVAIATLFCDLASPSKRDAFQQVRAGLTLCIEPRGWEIVFAQLTEIRLPER